MIVHRLVSIEKNQMSVQFPASAIQSLLNHVLSCFQTVSQLPTTKTHYRKYTCTHLQFFKAQLITKYTPEYTSPIPQNTLLQFARR